MCFLTEKTFSTDFSDYHSDETKKHVLKCCLNALRIKKSFSEDFADRFFSLAEMLLTHPDGCSSNMKQLIMGLAHQMLKYDNGLWPENEAFNQAYIDHNLRFNMEGFCMENLQGIQCGGCGRRENLDRGEKFKKCAACKKIYYCSRKCQKKDWKSGHQMSCKNQM